MRAAAVRASCPSSASAAGRRGRESSATPRAMIAPAMPSVACTTTAGMAVGITCRSRIRGVLGAERARRLHVLELARAQHLPAHQPRVADPPDHATARAARSPGSGRARRPARSRAACPGNASSMSITRLITSSTRAAEVAGDRAEQRADDRRDRDDGEADEKGDARARRAPAPGCRGRARRGRTDAPASVRLEPRASSCADGIVRRQRRPDQPRPATATTDDGDADASSCATR